jgi:transposase
LLRAFYSVRSERYLMEQMNYNLLFHWFFGLSIAVPVWVPAVFSHNRDCLLARDVAAEFMAAVLTLPQVEVWLSN